MTESAYLPTWAIVVTVLGAVLGACILIVLPYCFCRHRKRRRIIRRRKPKNRKSYQDIYASPATRDSCYETVSYRRDTAEGHYNHGLSKPSTIAIIPTGEVAAPLPPLDWPPPPPPPEVAI